MPTWKEECVNILIKLGEHTYLKDIYEEFERETSKIKTKKL